jgi:hypothetical protein
MAAREVGIEAAEAESLPGDDPAQEALAAGLPGGEPDNAFRARRPGSVLRQETPHRHGENAKRQMQPQAS